MNANTIPNDSSSLTPTVLVLGGTGKTGRRVVRRLEQRGVRVRVGSRSGSPAFDWGDRSGWDPVIEGVDAIYIAYHPDLAAPGASEAIRDLVEHSRRHGVGKLVLLSGRGEEEAERCEALVRSSGIAHTIVRCAWFNQNFSENFLRDMVRDGILALPVNGVREPFVDVEDIAEVAVAALTEDGHDGELYELTGPELLGFAEVAAELTRVTGREVRFQAIARDEFLGGLRSAGLPAELTSLLDYLFAEVLDGRNEWRGDGVERALGRSPRRFGDFVADAHRSGAWDA